MLVLIGFVALCLLVSGADAGLTEPAMRNWYPALRHPSGTPPDWVFPVVWIPLYLMMAVAAWRVWRLGTPGVTPERIRYRALLLWSLQLAVNASWTPVFFGLHLPWVALVLIVSLIVLVGLTARDFRRIDRIAGLLMAPYLAWVCYAAWLNAGIAWLNPA